MLQCRLSGDSTGRRTGFLIFPGFELLQLSGPLETFHMVGQSGVSHLAVLSLDGGPVESACGLTVMSRPITADGLDTLIVVGGQSARPIPSFGELSDFVCAASAVLRRVAGIGTGVTLLAEAGLLQGKKAVVSADWARAFTRAYPAIGINADRNFIKDGKVGTAGTAAQGIELCLALIEDDWGPGLSRCIAPDLPLDAAKSLYLGRPQQEMNRTEAAKRLRAESARRQVEDSAEPFSVIARAAGFSGAETMRSAFLRLFGQPPQVLRRAARQARRNSRPHRHADQSAPGAR